MATWDRKTNFWHHHVSSNILKSDEGLIPSSQASQVYAILPCTRAVWIEKCGNSWWIILKIFVRKTPPCDVSCGFKWFHCACVPDCRPGSSASPMALSVVDLSNNYRYNVGQGYVAKQLKTNRIKKGLVNQSCAHTRASFQYQHLPHFGQMRTQWCWSWWTCFCAMPAWFCLSMYAAIKFVRSGVSMYFHRQYSRLPSPFTSFHKTSPRRSSVQMQMKVTSWQHENGMAWFVFLCYDMEKRNTWLNCIAMELCGAIDSKIYRRICDDMAWFVMTWNDSLWYEITTTIWTYSITVCEMAWHDLQWYGLVWHNDWQEMVCCEVTWRDL